MIASLSFTGEAWIWPAVGFLIAATALLVWSYRGSPGGGIRWLCLGLKVLGIAALLICLLEPLWFGERARPGANLIAIVADNSQGMQIRDQGESQTRGEQLQDLLDPARAEWLARLGDTFEVRRFTFDARLQATNDFAELVYDGNASGIGGALRTVSERFQGRPLAGVILLTDGNATDLRTPLPDFVGLPPVHPVVIGDASAVRDIAIQQVGVTQSAFEDAPVTIQVDVGAAGFAGQTINARLVDLSGAVVQQQNLVGGRETDTLAFRFELKPETNGLAFYQVRVAEADAADRQPVDGEDPSGEATQANNSRVIVVNRESGPYRILYVSGRPNWEYKFLNRALQEDPEIDLVALIRIAKREPRFEFRGREGETSNPLYRGFGDQSPDAVQQYDQPVLQRLNTRDEFELLNGFPRVPEDLYEYHAIIVDDLEAEFFSPDQQSLLQKFVSERGGGFMMLGGMESFQEGSYAETPVASVLPVFLDRAPEFGILAPPRLFQLEREGWLQPWARVRSSQDQERARRETMPQFQVVNRVRGVKPGASVIGVMREPSGETIPGIVVHRYGRGRSAAMMIGDFWYWGMQDLHQDSAGAQEDMNKSWRQLTRWLVSDVPKKVELAVERQEGESANAVTLQVRVRDERYQPLDSASVMVEIEPVAFGDQEAPTTGNLTLRAEPALSEPGLYEVAYVSRTTGGYRATAIASNNVGAELGRDEAGWSVDLAAEEFRSLVPNAALLEAIATKTGGQVVSPDDLEDFASRLPGEKAPEMESWSYPLWHTPIMFAFALGCLLAEWGIRRWKGMP
jgi:uncharacterized membrane protein